MIHLPQRTFPEVFSSIKEKFQSAPRVATETWQGVKANTETIELRNVCFEIDLQGIETAEHWEKEIQPNLPWAREHFKERVGGDPLNPGQEWKNWPWGNTADRFRAASRFNHSYMERLWPKFARRTEDGRLPIRSADSPRGYPAKDWRPYYGIGGPYGDLWDLVELLVKQPHTRQGWIPLFFPEDTGEGDGGRKPCTLGYQILIRGNEAHIWYPLRSCDFLRHARDDCYLAVRLLIWIVQKCRMVNPDGWKDIKLGTYAMHTTSLHVFPNDIAMLEKMNDKL